MIAFGRLALAAALLAVGAGCGGELAPSSGEERPEAAPDLPSPPPLDPGVLDQVSALAVGDGFVFVAGEAGVLRLDPVGGAYSLLADAEEASSAGAVALARSEDGRLWSAHRVVAQSSDDSGGLRCWTPGEARPRAWRVGGDAAALAVSSERAVAALDGGLAQLALDDPEADFEGFFDSPNRRLEVVSFDEEGARLRKVIEFRPRGERVLALSLVEPVLWVGTTHGLYRLSGDELRRYEVPCRVRARPPRRVHALAAAPGRLIAVLGLETEEGEWVPGGLLELDGEAGWRCHEPDVDVPDSPSLAVAEAEGTTWLATYEGPTRIRDEEAELLDAAAGAPALPTTAVSPETGESSWFGTWGGGVWHLDGRTWTAYSFGVDPSGRARITTGELR